jgi:phospholipid-binding lipoprotein MlaA
MAVSRRASARTLSILALGLTLSACAATTPGTDRLAERDPWEGFNRAVWAVNRGADKVIAKPITKVYRAVTPKPARDGIRNVFANVEEPYSLINNVMQGKINRAFRNLGRFVINSTIGLGGLFDHARRMGIKPAQEDFGQTFAVWGANGGPYVMLPLLGPSTFRDSIGTGLAFVGDPYQACLTYCGLPHRVPLGISAMQVISARSELIETGADNFLETSLDPYAAARSAFLQQRRAQILDQEGDEAAAEAAAAADVTANPLGGTSATAPDADAGIPASETAPQPAAASPPATPEAAPKPTEPGAPTPPKQPN